MKQAVPGYEKMLNIQKAWRQGKNPWITIANPDKSVTNRPFIRIKMNELNGKPPRKSW